MFELKFCKFNSNESIVWIKENYLIERNSLIQTIDSFELNLKNFNSNKTSFDQMKICLNWIYFSIKKQIMAPLYGQLNNLFDSRKKFIWFVQIFIWFLDISFDPNKYHLIQINLLFKSKQVFQTNYFLWLKQNFFLSAEDVDDKIAERNNICDCIILDQRIQIWPRFSLNISLNWRNIQVKWNIFSGQRKFFIETKTFL